MLTPLLQEDTIIANRRSRLSRALRLVRWNNVKVGRQLVALGVVRRRDVPTDLVNGPVYRALHALMQRRKRAAKRMDAVLREIRRRREFVEKMERLEWAKMTRWERRLNWDMAPAVVESRGFTERVRHWVMRKLETARIVLRLDRTMMFQGDREFRNRTRRVVATTVRG